MDTLSATNKANGSQPKAPGVQTVARRLLNIRMVGQSQIIVSAHVDDVRPISQCDVIFLVGGDNTFCLPEASLFDPSNFVSKTAFRSVVAHVSPSNRG